MTAEPYVIRDDDGTARLVWPDGLQWAKVAREVLEDFVATVNELVSLKARRCDGCAWYASGPRRCSLAAGGYNEPTHADAPMWADGNDGYDSWLHVAPDHHCAAWKPCDE